ncbi:MAG: hypothetical protein WDN26_01735 [Chitinophagaceae bacterium]
MKYDVLKYIGWHIIGLAFAIFFLREIIVFINSRFAINMISTQVNDYFQVGVRIFLSYCFGAAYFFFKTQRLKINLTDKQVFFSVISLLTIIVAIDFIQVLIISLVLLKKQMYMRLILPLWLSFPIVIFYFACIFKYWYRKNIKWFW